MSNQISQDSAGPYRMMRCHFSDGKSLGEAISTEEMVSLSEVLKKTTPQGHLFDRPLCAKWKVSVQRILWNRHEIEMATVQEKTGCLADIPVRKQSSCGPWSPKTTGGERHQPKHSTDRNLVGDSIQSSQRSAMKGLLQTPSHWAQDETL